MTTQDTAKLPAGLAKIARSATKKGAALVTQAVAGVTGVVAVGGLAGFWWALLAAAGVLAIAGILAEL